MHKGVLGKDYVVLKGRGGREYQNGAKVGGNRYMHLSIDHGQSTICGKTPKEFLLTYTDVVIDCPECVKGILAKTDSNQ